MVENADSSQETEAVYKKYLDELNKSYLKNQELFEKQLSYISAGALIVSFAFVENIVGDFHSVQDFGLLISTWGLWVLALIVNLTSYPISARILYNVIKQVQEDEDNFNRTSVAKKTQVIAYFNYASLAFLFIGIILFSLFVYINHF